MFYALSKNENKLKDKVNLFVALAPVLRIGNTPLQHLKEMTSSREQFLSMINYYEMYEIANNEVMNLVKKL